MNLNKLQREVKKIYKETDYKMKLLPKVCCKRCSFCCHQCIEIVPVEELLITHYLNTFVKSELKEKIRSNLITWLNYFDANTPNKTELRIPDIRAFEITAAKNRIPCPFLINNECTIYEARPIVCRTHIVEDSPELCESDPLRKPSEAGEKTRIEKFIALQKLDIKQMPVRFLSYALIDYFKIDRILKPIQWAPSMNSIFYG